jgi:hypothetical protein
VSRRGDTLARLQPYIERARTFSGWSFDDLAVRDLDPPPPWDYAAIAREHAARAGHVLDIGTGGGEVFSRVIGGLEAGAVATEEWHVNAPVAQGRLRQLGAGVVRARAQELPFRCGAFELVIDRHEAIDPDEVIRVLDNRGAFVTQQVWRKEWIELDRFFPTRRTQWGDHLAEYRGAFDRAGYRVEVREHSWQVAYAGLGEVVYMLVLSPWEIEDFDPEGDIDILIEMEDALTTPDGLVMTADRYLLLARWFE